MKFVLLFFLAPLLCTPNSKITMPESSEKGFAVIELFTSEGCSSCPSADRLIEKTGEEYKGKDVLILSYHVDYWNRLGWKDRFSNAENTKRQNYYANIFRLNSIYTPQVVVNGTTEFVGSDRTRLVNAIRTSKKMSKELSISVSADNNNKIAASYNISNKTLDQQILIALIEKKAVTEVKRGENEGRKLNHINIVRQFFIREQNSGSVEFKITEKNKEDYFIAILLQNESTGTIEGYAVTEIQ